MNQNLASFLEEFAANTWPPLRTQHLDGWRLRYSEGVHSRANSVWPNESNDQISLAEKLDLVEAFYARCQQPTRYQISPAMVSAHLDEVLAERSYTLYEPVEVQPFLPTSSPTPNPPILSQSPLLSPTLGLTSTQPSPNASHAYSQVVSSNIPAQTLYHRAGFTHHYRLQP